MYSQTAEQQNAALAARAEPIARLAVGKKFKVVLSKTAKTRTTVEGTIVECRLLKIVNRYTPAGTRVAECRFESVIDTGLGKHTVVTRDLPR